MKGVISKYREFGKIKQRETDSNQKLESKIIKSDWNGHSYPIDAKKLSKKEEIRIG
jgi:hypothetical protein